MRGEEGRREAGREKKGERVSACAKRLEQLLTVQCLKLVALTSGQ